MTYADQVLVLGRTPCRIVELDLDYCEHTYGDSPCTAAIGTTGLDRCCNTRATCQDPNNYLASAKTYRFSDIEVDDPAAMSGGVPCLPLVISVSIAPAKLDPGMSIGQRTSVTVNFRDTTYSDRGVDKYAALRDFDPAERSTFWKKLRARNPYYQGRVMRVRTGYLEGGLYDPANFVTRTFFIDTIRGPSANEGWTVIAKDVLRFADDQKAQAPIANHGKLLNAMDAVTLTATLSPTGIGDLEYAASGTVYIDAEFITFTRIGDDLTFIMRGSDGSVPAAHAIGVPVQVCARWTELKPHLIVHDLLVNYAGVPSAYIDLSAWSAECDVWLGGHTLTRLIGKPIGVKTLLDELMQQGLITIWWDDLGPTIPLVAMHPPYPLDVTELNETYHLVEGTVAVSENNDKRATEVWVYFALKDPTLDDKQTSFSNLEIAIDEDAEDPSEYDSAVIMVVFSRWLRAQDTTQARLMGWRLRSRYRDPMITLSFALDAKDSATKLGDSVNITCRQLPDPLGVIGPTLFQITSAQDPANGSTFNYQALLSNFYGHYGYITPDDAPDYVDATADELKTYFYITDNNGKNPDGTNGTLLS